MKKLFTLCSILFISFLFVSCSSDKPDDLPISINATAQKSFTIIAAAGDETSKEVTFALSDFAALKDYMKYVESGSVETSSSYIEVKGNTENVELINVRLSMSRDSKKFIILEEVNSNKKYQGLSHLNFLQNIIDEMSSRDSSTVKLSYKANSNITLPVTITIYISSRFTF